MDMSNMVIQINKSKNYNSKDFKSILNYVYLMFFNYPLKNKLIDKSNIGDFIIKEYNRFEKIIKSYTSNQLDFESYLFHIIRQEAKFYNIKQNKKEIDENYKVSYYNLNEINNNKEEDSHYNSKLKLAFSSKDNIKEKELYNLNMPDKLNINPKHVLILATICSPQLSSYQINRLNKYFIKHGINNFIELCSKSSIFNAKKDKRKENVENRLNYNFNKLIEYENKINICNEVKEDPTYLIVKRDKCKRILEENTKIRAKVTNRITYREISKILDINSSTIASNMRKLKYNLEHFKTNEL